MEPLTQLTPLEYQAIGIVAAGADDSRSKLEPGEGQKVNVLLRIRGTIDVGEDGETSQVRVPSAVDVLAWVLAQPIGEGGDQLLQRLRESGRDGRLLEVEERYVAQATMAIAAVSPSVKAPRQGSVRGTLRVGVVSSAHLTEEVSGAVEQYTRMIKLG